MKQLSGNVQKTGFGFTIGRLIGATKNITVYVAVESAKATIKGVKDAKAGYNSTK